MEVGNFSPQFSSEERLRNQFIFLVKRKERKEEKLGREENLSAEDNFSLIYDVPCLLRSLTFPRSFKSSESSSATSSTTSSWSPRRRHSRLQTPLTPVHLATARQRLDLEPARRKPSRQETLDTHEVALKRVTFWPQRTTSHLQTAPEGRERPSCPRPPSSSPSSSSPSHSMEPWPGGAGFGQVLGSHLDKGERGQEMKVRATLWNMSTLAKWSSSGSGCSYASSSRRGSTAASPEKNMRWTNICTLGAVVLHLEDEVVSPD